MSISNARYIHGFFLAIICLFSGRKIQLFGVSFFLRQIREKFASFLLQIVEDRVIMVTHFSALRLKTYSCKMFLQLLTQKETEHKANLLLILYLFKI